LSRAVPFQDRGRGTPTERCATTFFVALKAPCQFSVRIIAGPLWRKRQALSSGGPAASRLHKAQKPRPVSWAMGPRQVAVSPALESAMHIPTASRISSVRRLQRTMGSVYLECLARLATYAAYHHCANTPTSMKPTPLPMPTITAAVKVFGIIQNDSAVPSAQIAGSVQNQTMASAGGPMPKRMWSVRRRKRIEFTFWRASKLSCYAHRAWN
jgi:hypothetical protein